MQKNACTNHETSMAVRQSGVDMVDVPITVSSYSIGPTGVSVLGTEPLAMGDRDGRVARHDRGADSIDAGAAVDGLAVVRQRDTRLARAVVQPRRIVQRVSQMEAS